MDLIEVTLLITAVLINFILLGLVYVRNQQSATHRLFSLLVLVMSLWSVTNFLAVNASTALQATWFVRGVMFFAAPLSVLFFLLMHTYPRVTMSLSRRAKIIWTILTLVTMIIAISPLLFPTVQFTPGRPPSPSPGIGMVFFVPVAIGTIPLGIFYLIRKIIRSRGHERLQMKFLAIGVTIMFTLIIVFNFISVVVFNISAFNKYGPLFTLPFTIITAYTIVRHRLMDIRGAIARTLSFSFLVGAFFAVYGATLIFAVPILADLVGVSDGIIAALAALLSVFIARYIQDVLRRLTDRYLFQQHTDYHAALLKVSQRLSRTIKIDEVDEILLFAFHDILRVSSVSIYLQGSNKSEFTLRASIPEKKAKVAVTIDNPLLRYLQHAGKVLIKDELVVTIEQEQKPQHVAELKEIQTIIEGIDAAAIVPLFIEKGLSGFIILGPKKSGQPYLQNDIEFLETLAPQAAIALENARLYQESLEFGQRLRVEVKRATEKLEIANTQLKELDRAKSEFLSIASHQLYTPLTAIRGYLSMLREGDFGPLDQKHSPIIDIVNKSAERLIDLIKNLLDISRIESGRFELNLEVLDLARMAKEIVQDLLPNAMNKKLKLVWHDPPAPVPSVVADQARLRQVVLNFIDNAIKYTNRGHIDVTIAARGDTVEFMVTDTGRGLSKEEIPTLFTKFTRAGGASRYHTEGTGLGLYVARQIIREHRGEVSVTSPGKEKGSTFSIRMPAEGTAKSLKVGDKATVTIKAAPTGSN